MSDVSFKLARTVLAHGEWPEAEKIRIEEFVNYFETQYPGKKDLDHIQRLKGMCREWEAATEAASRAGVRVAMFA